MSNVATRRACILLSVLLVATVVGSLPTTAAAQGTQGTITGQVVSAGAFQPLAAAQVYIPALNIGVLSQPNGRYLLIGVPAGTYEIAVQLVGYETRRAEVAVEAGETATVDFQLTYRALELDELVVTGTGVVTERRRLGQTVETVGSGELEILPVSNLTEALSGRIAGVYAASTAEPGGSAPIVLRGSSSLTQRAEPLIYIDGVRVDNGRAAVSMVRTSALDQLNVNDVERVEVIKGAAAATLYGSQASSGVIQIFTKRGGASDPVYRIDVEQAFSPLPYGGPGNWGYDPETRTVLYSHPFKEVLGRTGYEGGYSLSVRGGTPGVQYSGSARFNKETGYVETMANSNASLRLGLVFKPAPNLDVETNANLLRTFTSAPHPDYNVGGGPMLSNPALVSELRPYGDLFYRIQDITRYQNELETHRIGATGRAVYRWTPNLVTQITAGVDRTLHERVSAVPVGHSLRDPEGFRSLRNDSRTAVTLEGTTSWQHEFGPALASTFVVGAQTFREESWNKSVGTRRFSSPALRTLSGGADVSGVGENFEQVINAGMFVQEQVGLWDRFFLTGGVRIDGSSAFGSGLGFEVYPKAGMSWVVSDHAFWNVPGVEQLRVRGAVGTSGMQPAAFDAQRMWRPATLLDNQSVVLPLNLGNANLKPERSTEVEFGAELGMAGGRVGLELVYFHQETNDALLPAPAAPSEGFLRPQLTNLGRLTSEGMEAGLNVSWIERGGVSLRTQSNIATLKQRVVDMGGVEDYIIVGRRTYNGIAEGYSPGAIRAPVSDPANPYRVAVPIEDLTALTQITPNTLKDAAGRDSLVFIGNSIPTLTGSFSPTLATRGLRLVATFTGAAGFIMSNETEVVRESIRNTKRAAEFEKLLADPATPTSERQRIADEYGRKHHLVVSHFMGSGDFIRFQELALAYDAPEAIFGRLGLGMKSLQITVAARNLKLWTKWDGVQDPLTTANFANPVLVGNIEYMGYGVPRRFSLRIGTTF